MRRSCGCSAVYKSPLTNPSIALTTPTLSSVASGLPFNFSTIHRRHFGPQEVYRPTHPSLPPCRDDRLTYLASGIRTIRCTFAGFYYISLPRSLNCSTISSISQNGISPICFSPCAPCLLPPQRTRRTSINFVAPPTECFQNADRDGFTTGQSSSRPLRCKCLCYSQCALACLTTTLGWCPR